MAVFHLTFLKGNMTPRKNKFSLAFRHRHVWYFKTCVTLFQLKRRRIGCLLLLQYAMVRALCQLSKHNINQNEYFLIKNSNLKHIYSIFETRLSYISSYSYIMLPQNTTKKMKQIIISVLKFQTKRTTSVRKKSYYARNLT